MSRRRRETSSTEVEMFDAGGSDLDLRIPGCPGPAWKAVRTFRGEYFDAFEYDFCMVTVVKVLKAVEYPWKMGQTGSSLRQTRVIKWQLGAGRIKTQD